MQISNAKHAESKDEKGNTKAYEDKNKMKIDWKTKLNKTCIKAILKRYQNSWYISFILKFSLSQIEPNGGFSNKIVGLFHILRHRFFPIFKECHGHIWEPIASHSI